MNEIANGRFRRAYILESLDGFYTWCNSLNTPTRRVIVGTIMRLCELSVNDLSHAGSIWVHEAKTNPPIYAIRKGQARLYCCLKDKDIVILHWVRKKSKKADPAALRKAERLAKEVLSKKKL